MPRPLANPAEAEGPALSAPKVTPLKPKACAIALPPLRICGNADPNGAPSSVTVKRQRLSEHVIPLIAGELEGCIHNDPELLNRILKDTTEDIAHSILQRLVDSEYPGFLAHTRPITGMAQQQTYFSCDPHVYTDVAFPEWFCGFANLCTAHASMSAIPDPSLSPLSSSSAAGTIWRKTKDRALPGIQTGNQRPDFCLTLCEASRTSTPPPTPTGTGTSLENSTLTASIANPSGPAVGQGLPQPPWRSVLVVGEHHSRSSTYPESQIQLDGYAEQVFIAQPFRRAVWGLFTSNTKPTIFVYRFDRAGAFCRVLDYSSTEKDLLKLVRLLVALAKGMDAQEMGFHTESITWRGEAYPLDVQSSFRTMLLLKEGTANGREGLITLDQLIFNTGGLVSRGTRVWKGALTAEDGTTTPVAVKYSWQATTRLREGALYRLAAERDVIGLGQFIAYNTFEDIHTDIRHSHLPLSEGEPGRSKPNDYLHAHNRILTRLILGNPGSSLAEETLSPLSIARALFAALIGQASLFFNAQILHRDISTCNIISSHHPIITTHSPAVASSSRLPVLPAGTPLYGYLIDLDYAIDVNTLNASGAHDRTGTFPFLAINILSGSESHRYRHDLESLFYVFLVMCCYPGGLPPHYTPRRRASSTGQSKTTTRKSWSTNKALRGLLLPPGRPQDEQDAGLFPPENPLGEWFTGSLWNVYTHKTTGIVTSDWHFEVLLTRFRSCFATDAWKEAARRFRLALWAEDDGGVGCKLASEQPMTVRDCDAGGVDDGGLPGPAKKVCRRRTAPRWIRPDEIRVNVPNWDGFVEIREVLGDLVVELEGGMAVASSVGEGAG